MGHAIGLVDNGLPLTSDHYDEEADAAGSPAHCSNPNCVMYWANTTSTTELVNYISNLLGQEDTTDLLLFGDECLDDVRAAAGLTPQ